MDALNDHEQAQLLRQWWQENWLPLVLGLVIALGGVLGWQFWQGYKQSQSEEASAEYESLREALGTQQDALIEQKLARLFTDYAGTPYAALGALAAAQHYAAAQSLDKAQKPLAWAADKASDEGVRQLAKLRLARVLWAQNQPEQALKALSASPDKAFAPLFAELRGDILLSQGKRTEARAAYEKALESLRKLSETPAAAPAAADGEAAEASAEKSADSSAIERKLADLRADSK